MLSPVQLTWANNNSTLVPHNSFTSTCTLSLSETAQCVLTSMLCHSETAKGTKMYRNIFFYCQSRHQIDFTERFCLISSPICCVMLERVAPVTSNSVLLMPLLGLCVVDILHFKDGPQCSSSLDQCHSSCTMAFINMLYLHISLTKFV